MDTFSDSDPYVVLEYRTHHSQPWTKVGKTETLQNNHFPKFNTPIELPYYFERMQMLRLTVFDADEGGNDDFLGVQEFNLAEIITSDGSSLEKALDVSKVRSLGTKKMKSTIRVSAQELTAGKRYLCKFAVYNLPVSTVWCVFKREPRPAFRVYEVVQGTRKLICAGNAEKRGSNIMFPTTELMVSFGAEETLFVELYDQRSSGKQELFGDLALSRVFLDSSGRTVIPVEGDRSSSDSLLNAPQFAVEKSAPLTTFFDHFTSGGSISLAVGIDFTASNGNPNQPGSLHHKGNFRFYPETRFDAQRGLFLYDNPYQRAIHEVVSILDYYDSDHQYPVYGFGAKVADGRGAPMLSHCFQLSGMQSKPYVEGVQGLFAAYATAVNSVELWGPTLFAPLIETVCTLVREKNPQTATQCRDYTILLILTDGQIMDMDKTKKAIIEASTLPLSIVIVGIGNEDFSSMMELDGDDHLLSVTLGANTLQAKRDIVQFVNMNSLPPGNHEALVRSVLEEIPKQYVDYVKLAMSTQINVN
jgi:hypothetical protein